jgi:16S rRNA (guanine527-N7)-methyltransferase
VEPARGVSRETRARLEAFADTLRKWQPRINLVSRATVDDLWNRHIADSMQIFEYCPAMPGIGRTSAPAAASPV